MPKTLVTEAIQATGTATAQAGGVFLIDLITPGWGSSGYYSAEVLEQAAKDRIFPAGMQMFINHQTAQERNDRPEGDLHHLAAALQEDAVWNPTGGEEGTGSLQSPARVYSTWREPLAEMKDNIGTSIRAAADIEYGEAEGRAGRIIGRLVHAESVDFVTKAGRGGRIVEVLEAAAVQEARNIGQWIESRIHRDFTITADDMAGDGRLTREERIGLSSAIGDALQAFVARLETDQPQLYARDLYDNPTDTVAVALEATGRRAVEATANEEREALDRLVRSEYGDDDTHVWLQDFDETTAWFQVSTNDSAHMYAQTYTTGDDDLADTLTGERTEVRQVTTYVPVHPAGRSTESLGEIMGTTQIEESELSGLREAAGRVSALESERDTAVTERDEALAELAEARTQGREATVARIIAEADAEFNDLEVAGLNAVAAKHTTDGVLNEEAFSTAVGEAAAAHAAANGAGSVRGNGHRDTTSESVTLADLDESLDATFGGPIVKEA